MLTVMTYNVGAGLAPADRLVDILLGETYPHQSLHPSGIPGKGILSRYPVHEIELLDLHPGRPDLQATINCPLGEVTIIVAHPPPPRFGRNRIVQTALANEQIARIAAVATRGHPAILLTDFNRVGWQAGYRQLRGSGLIDAFGEVGQGPGFTLPTRWSHLAYRGHPLGEIPLPPLLRVDYVWHTAHFRALESWIGDHGGSDHLPVLATLARVDHRREEQ
jgi:endonuclease/exonuclease/phosphatase family metal-dependent hydrolase